MAKEKKRGRWLQVIFILLILWLLSSAIANLLKSDFGVDKIVVIPISGMLALEEMDFPFKGISSTDIVSRIEEVEKDKSIKGVILEIDSGGGTVFASKEITDAVKKLRKEKPVTALIK